MSQNFHGMSQQTDAQNMWNGKTAKSHLLHGAKLTIWHCVSKDILVSIVKISSSCKLWTY